MQRVVMMIARTRSNEIKIWLGVQPVLAKYSYNMPVFGRRKKTALYWWSLRTVQSQRIYMRRVGPARLYTEVWGDRRVGRVKDGMKSGRACKVGRREGRISLPCLYGT
jgi:hypothetical protein